MKNYWSFQNQNINYYILLVIANFIQQYSFNYQIRLFHSCLKYTLITTWSEQRTFIYGSMISCPSSIKLQTSVWNETESESKHPHTGLHMHIYASNSCKCPASDVTCQIMTIPLLCNTCPAYQANARGTSKGMRLA